jgi:hypothetical protein
MYFVFNNFFSKIMLLENKVEKHGTVRQGTDNKIIQLMSFACWITNTTGTNSECVTLTAFPRQQWFRGSASLLRYTYIACLFSKVFQFTVWYRSVLSTAHLLHFKAIFILSNLQM